MSSAHAQTLGLERETFECLRADLVAANQELILSIRGRSGSYSQLQVRGRAFIPGCAAGPGPPESQGRCTPCPTATVR